VNVGSQYGGAILAAAQKMGSASLGACRPIARSPMSAALAQLREDINNAVDSMSRLEERLTPVLASPVPRNETDGKPEMSPASEMHETLLSMSITVCRLAQQIQMVDSRVTV